MTVPCFPCTLAVSHAHEALIRIPPIWMAGLSVTWNAFLQGKRHQQNMAKRAAREAAEKPAQPAPQRRAAVKKTVKIGRPGYRVTKQFDSDQDQRSLLFQVSPGCIEA